MKRGEPAVRAGAKHIAPGVTMQEYRHAIGTAGGDVDVRSFISRGLDVTWGCEVIATVPAAWRAEEVDAAVKLMNTLPRLSKVGPGGYSGFRDKALGGDGTHGLVYTWAERFDGIPGSEDALAAILLHPEELQIVMRGFTTRVLGALGAASSYYPFPPVWEVRKRPVIPWKAHEASVFEQATPRLECTAATAVMVGKRLVLSVPSEGVPELARRGAAKTYGLAVGFDPDADGQHFWTPGSKDTCVTTLGNRTPKEIGQAFVLFTMHERRQLGMLEDGVVVMLAPDRYAIVLDALAAGRAIEEPVGEHTLAIEPFD